MSSCRVTWAMISQAGTASAQHQILTSIDRQATEIIMKIAGIMGTPATVGTRVQPLKSGNGEASPDTAYAPPLKIMLVMAAAEPAMMQPMAQRTKVSFSTIFAA